MTYYIFKSEKGKHTCGICSSLDGREFYNIKDIPKLPLHPNCRCSIIPVDEKTKGEKCNCIDILKVLQNNIENVILNLKKIKEDIKDENSNFEYTKKLIQNTITSISIKLENIEPELKMHLPDCKNYAGDSYKILNDYIKQITELKNKNETVSNNIANIYKNLEEFEKNTKNLLTDINFLMDNASIYAHLKSECKIEKELTALNSKTKQTLNEFDKYIELITQINEDNKKINNAINAAGEYLETIEEKKKVPCACACTQNIKAIAGDIAQEVGLQTDKLATQAKETVAAIGFALKHEAKSLTNVINLNSVKNLANSATNTEVAKQNINARVLNSPEEIKNEDLKKELIDKIKIPKTSKGIIYYPDSRESARLYRTNEIKEFISKNYTNLIHNTQTKVNDIEFKKFSDPDAYLALQHCKLYEPKITKDGYFEGLIIDYYNFEYRELKKGFDLIDNTYILLNNAAYEKQKKGKMKNYFLIYAIKQKL